MFKSIPEGDKSGSEVEDVLGVQTPQGADL